MIDANRVSSHMSTASCSLEPCSLQKFRSFSSTDESLAAEDFTSKSHSGSALSLWGHTPSSLCSQWAFVVRLSHITGRKSRVLRGSASTSVTSL